MKKIQFMGVFLAALISMPVWASDILIIGIQDYNRSPIMIVREYQGLTSYLSKALKRPVRVETVKTRDEYLKKSHDKRFAFMYGPPSMIMRVVKQSGYQPVVKIPGLLSASFISLASTGIAFPEDMKGKRIGFTDKDSMITQMAIAQLKEMKIDPEKYFKSVHYYNDVDGVLSAMKFNLIDIGVANSSNLNVWSGKGNDVNLVLQGKGMPHLTFAVNNDLPADIKDAVTQALLKAHLDSEGQDYFKYSSFPNFEPAKPADYDELVNFLNIR